MKLSQLKTAYRNKGFTLVEVIVVMAIIVILSGLGLFSFNFVQRKQRAEQANIQIAEMDAKVAEYKLDVGAPLLGDASDNSSIALYQMLSGDANNDGQLDEGANAYITSMVSGGQKRGYKVSPSYQIMDPYNRPYRYQYPGQRNPPNEVDIWSAGPDGIDGNEDDHKNW